MQRFRNSESTFLSQEFLGTSMEIGRKALSIALSVKGVQPDLFTLNLPTKLVPSEIVDSKLP